ncbi:MAG: hypothetical protein Roseis2KO_39140 [Roseivirga sp.]
MKRILLSLFCILSAFQLQGQNQFDYAYSFGSTGQVIDHILGPDDRSYILVRISGSQSIKADPQNQIGDLTRSNPQASIVYTLIVLNPDGSSHLALKFEMATITLPPDIAVNSLGEIYVFGDFKDSIWLNQDTPTVSSHTLSGSHLFFAKYGANGSLLYSKATNGPAMSTITGQHNIALINDTDFTISTVLPSIVDMSFQGSSVQNYGATGQKRTFLGLYKNDGTLDQGYDMGGEAVFQSMAANSLGDLFGFGYMVSGTADLDPGASTVSLSSTSKSQNFLVKYNSSLDYQNHINMGRGTISSTRFMTIGPGDSVIISGSTAWEGLYPDPDRDRLDLDNSSGTFEAVSDQSRGVFIGKYGKDLIFGGGFVFGGTEASDVLISGIDANSDRIMLNTYSGGITSGLLDFGGDNKTFLVNDGRAGHLSLDRSNQIIGYEELGATVSARSTLRANGDIVYMGFATNSSDLDSGSDVFTLSNIPSGGGLYVARMTACIGNSTIDTPTSLCFNGSYTIGNNTYTEDGTYIDILQDANGCDNLIVTNLVFPTTNPVATATAVSDVNTCNGDSTGSFSLVVTNGVSPYEVSFDGSAFYPVPDNGLFENSPALSNETILVRDANGCTFNTNAITISEPVNVTFNSLPQITDVSCAGGNDGVLSVSLTGGSGTYEYSIDGIIFQSSGLFENLEAGSYNITGRDSQGCDVSLFGVQVAEPTAMTINSSSVAASACGVADGSLEVTSVMNGAAPFEYSINEGAFQSNGLFNNLATGLYTITVKDNNGCTMSFLEIVGGPSPINVSTSFLDPTCFGANNGEATLSNPTGGSGNYTYSIDGINFQSSGTFTGLGEGQYTIMVKDDNGCAALRNVFLFEPPQLVLNMTMGSTVTCNGGNDGSVTLQASGGTPIYSYSADGINYTAPTNSPETLSGLSGGITTFYVRDVNGCIATVDINIPEPAGTAIVVNQDAAIECFGDNTAAISIAATSPVAGALEYSLDGTTFGSASSFTGLAAGDYTAYVKDPNGCIQEFDFAIDQPDQIMPTLVTNNISCNGQTDGSITVTASGGTGTLTYSIDGTNFSTNNSFQNLATGSYTISIKDDNDCTVTISETISEPTLLALVIDGFSNPACNGDSNGSFSLSGSGGTGTYEYSIDGTNFQDSGTFSGLRAGTYNFTIRDINGCTQTGIGQLTDPAVLTSSATVNNTVSCFGGMDGSATVTAAGGNSPYTYSLDGVTFNNTTGTFDALAAGNHTITTKDANGCTTTAMVTMTEPAAIVASAVVDNQVTCSGSSDGATTGSATGGTAPYTYSIDGVSFQNTATFSGLSAGMVTLSVKDANDCIVTTTVQVTEPAAILLDAMVTPASCAGASDASVTLVASNGVGAYEYSLDGGAFSANATFSGLAAGDTYVFTVKDANGCTTSISPKVGEPSPLTLNFEAVDITCNGEADGQIAGFTQGGTAPYQYSLDGTNFQNGPFGNLGAGSYTLTVKDSQGCTTDQAVTINEPDVLAAATTIISQVSCNGAADGMASIAVTGGSVPYSYSLDGTAFSNSIDLTALSPATYTVTVRDANNCEATSSFTITEPEVLTVSTEITAALCNGGTNGSITVNASGGTAPFTYALDGGAFGSSDKFENLEAGTYAITVKDINDCTVTANATVSEPDAIVISNTTVVPPLCNGDSNVEITVTASGGTGTLEYSLDGTNYQSSNSFTGLTAGTYDITVRDANSCTATTNAIIADPDAIVLSTTVTDVLCFGESNGEISITASGGTGALEYSIDGTTFQSEATFTGLAAGDYAPTVRDANGCTRVATVSVAEPAVLSVSATVVSNNTINVTATGGTSPYEYSIDGTNFQSASSFSNLANGDYTITVRDANSCTATTSGSLIVTAIDDVPDFELIQIYPNPVSDYLIFSRLKAGDEIRLVSLNGNSLDLATITEDKDKYQMDISGIRQKVFLAVVVSKEGRVKLNQKVIKKQ